MIRLSFFLLLPFFTLPVFAQVNISLKNISSERLEAVTLNGIAVGIIEKNEIKIVTLDSVKLMDRSPQLTIAAIFKGKKLESGAQGFCGTPMPKSSIAIEGTYHRDIMVGTNRNNPQPYIALSIGPDKEKWDMNH